MSISSIFIIIVLVLFITFFMYIEPIISKQKIKNNNEYGSARFLTKREIKKNYEETYIDNIYKVGFPILYDKKIKKVWFDNETPHWVYLGSSGSGKTVSSVIPLCSLIANSKEERSVFITDPKGEIFQKCSRMFDEHGYKIITIDFRQPHLSNHINVLEPIIIEYEKHIGNEKEIEKINIENKIIREKNIEYNEILKLNNINKKERKRIKKEIINNYNKIKENNKHITNLNSEIIISLAESNRLITNISSMIMQEKGQVKDPFWNNSAKNLLEGLIGFFLEEYKIGKIKREQITLTSIRKFQNSIMEETNAELFKTYINKKEYGSKSKDSLVSILSSAENTYKSITAVFGEKMNIFDDLNVANITSTTDFKIDILGEEKTAFFVIVPDEERIYYSLISIIVGLLYKGLVKSANNRKEKMLKVPIDWILDEFANCPPLNDIESMISVSRSRGMKFHFYIQSFAQLNNVYGKEVAQVILDNCGLAYLKTNTMDSAQEISKMLGKKTLESSSISQSLSLLNYNGNKSNSLMGRELLTPDEVKNLYRKMIIFPSKGYPILRDTIVYNKFSCYKDGMIERKKQSLKNLNNTYFTMEQLVLNESNNDSKETFLNEQKNYQIKLFEKAILILNELFEGYIEKIEYKESNNQTYAEIIISIYINNKDLIVLRTRFMKLNYHIETNTTSESKTIINVHLINQFEQFLQ